MRGTPFLYNGEELGLEDADVPADRVVDPGGRDACRAPMPWDAGPTHGWGTDDPWLPWPPEPDVRNVDSLTADPDSILHLYRRVLAARRASPALRLGDIELLEAPEGVLAFVRTGGDGDDGDRRVVLVNFGSDPVSFAPRGGWTVEVASDGREEGQRFGGSVAGDTALVLRPAAASVQETLI